MRRDCTPEIEFILTHPIYTTVIGNHASDILNGGHPDLAALRGK